MPASMTGHILLLRTHRAELGGDCDPSQIHGLTSATWRGLRLPWCASSAECWSTRLAARCGRLRASPPGKRDAFGGWTLAAPQKWWGHRAEKETWFYVVGCEPGDMPGLPYSMAEATHVVQSRKRQDCRPHITKAEREHTPPELAVWLVELARRCTLQPQPA